MAAGKFSIQTSLDDAEVWALRELVAKSKSKSVSHYVTTLIRREIRKGSAK